MRWIGISGTWRITNNDVERDVRVSVREIILRGDGIVSGGALGVDYYATDEAMKLDFVGSQIKVVLPASLQNYVTHLRMWVNGFNTDDIPIGAEIAEQLIEQLNKLNVLNPNAVIANSLISAREIDQSAYYERNTTIVSLASEMIAFQVNKSPGTQDTIDKARRAGKGVVVHSYKVVEEPQKK
jgi:predicted Rossmann fold nucleotide-binding protein DprA/Smf involved in DNA uptake